MRSNFFFSNLRRGVRGFTLIELLVVAGMLILIAGVILASNRGTRRSVRLTNGLNEIAVLVKEAETYGLSGRGTDTGTEFGKGYGVHADPADSTHLILFRDLDADNRYDTSPSELVRTYTLPAAVTVSRVCGYTDVSGTEVCPTSLDVVYTRPGPDPVIKGYPAGSTYVEGRFYLTSGGVERYVKVTNTGQIAIE